MGKFASAKREGASWPGHLGEGWPAAGRGIHPIIESGVLADRVEHRMFLSYPVGKRSRVPVGTRHDAVSLPAPYIGRTAFWDYSGWLPDSRRHPTAHTTHCRSSRRCCRRPRVERGFRCRRYTEKLNLPALACARGTWCASAASRMELTVGKSSAASTGMMGHHREQFNQGETRLLDRGGRWWRSSARVRRWWRVVACARPLIRPVA